MVSTVNILLVDDESRNLDVLESILADPAYCLLRAENADLALKLLLVHQVAAIVLDIKMPGVSGFELARMIKNTRRFRETPIVFLTGYMLDDSDVMAGYGAGGVDYLTKPVNPDILRHKVAVFADLYRKNQALADVNNRLAELNDQLETRVRERTAELEKSEAALRAAARQKDDFIAILAHELRNPLAPLRTGLDILLSLQPGEQPPPVARALASMNRQLDHIVRLIDDLLDASRISRGLLELKRENVDLGALLTTAVDAARPLFERRQQALSVHAAPGVIAHADPTRIAQIIANLLHNAAKFTPDRGAVRIELTRERDKARIRVVDSGRGIAAENLERVFDMFVRLDRPGSARDPGLGVGLALARRLAEMHDGTLHAQSDGVGQGATFTLEIPADASRSLHAPRTHELSASEITALDILVVEDNEDVVESLRDLLDAIGHRVTVANNGTQGVELARQHTPAVVLCDLGLPDVDGIDVCRQIRALSGPKQPMMVALTGWGREEDRRRTSEAGFDHHLVKPVALPALLRILKTAPEKSAAD